MRYATWREIALLSQKRARATSPPLSSSASSSGTPAGRSSARSVARLQVYQVEPLVFLPVPVGYQA